MNADNLLEVISNKLVQTVVVNFELELDQFEREKRYRVSVLYLRFNFYFIRNYGIKPGWFSNATNVLWDEPG